jgi:site-specific DNA-methyltransferase (adenine-specific)/modification methylase
MEPVTIGRATLYCGDCREVLPGLPKVDAVVTDPPYGISDAPIKGQGRTGKRTGTVNAWHAESDWDHSIDPEWPAACAQVAPTVAWFGHWRKREEVTRSMPHPIRAEIVWAKDCHVGPPCPVAMRDERIWLFSESGITGARFETSVWDCPIIPTWSFKHHKNEKPVPLMLRLLAFLDPAICCDPFMGSGSTGVAAMMQGRKFIGIEKDPAHFETACRRIEEAQRQGDLFLEGAA